VKRAARTSCADPQRRLRLQSRHPLEGPVKNNFTFLAADPSRLVAFLVGRILPV